jgi:hypothetical protein
MKEGYQVEWHPSESAPFLGTEQFVKRVAKRRGSSFVAHPPSLERLWQEAAEHAGLSREALRSGGRSMRVVEARDGFIRRAVFEAGYRAVTVANFLGCHASNVSRALQKEAST